MLIIQKLDELVSGIPVGTRWIGRGRARSGNYYSITISAFYDACEKGLDRSFLL